MKAKHISCGPFVNESERKAAERIKTGLISEQGNDTWYILTNLKFSANHRLQSDEIDIVTIGPPGVRVIEVKHWTAVWARRNKELVIQEAERVTNKARKMGTTLRKHVGKLGRVDGAFLITKTASKAGVGSQHKPVRGVRFHSLKEWKSAIGFSGRKELSAEQVKKLAEVLEPRGSAIIDRSPSLLAGHINLKLLSDPEQRFHRVYSATHAARQEKVILHLYDLSGSKETREENRSQRQWESLRRLQQHSWAPRILESYQPVQGYPGELFFFTLVDPAAPTIAERAEDKSWSVRERIEFALAAVRALHTMHTEGGDSPEKLMLHRNLTPRTILVRHDNTPILAGFERAGSPADFTPSSPAKVADRDETLAAKAPSQSLDATDPQSDASSLCSSLAGLFKAGNFPSSLSGNTAKEAQEILKSGHTGKPASRSRLPDIAQALSNLLNVSASRRPPPQPSLSATQFWSEEQVIPFRGRDYRIVSRLGSGGTGAAFKVVEIDRKTGEDLGIYVAKVVPDEDMGNRVLRAYDLARAHIARHSGLSGIFEVAGEWRENEFVALMTWVEGTPLNEWIGLLSLLAEEEEYFEDTAEELALRWLRTICHALSVLHDNGMVHGDVSLRNLILSEGNLVLTDYDCVVRLDTQLSPGTALYCSPSHSEGQLSSPSDDLYALAASMFHALYDREPFTYKGKKAKERGLNWEGLPRDEHPLLVEFLDRATNPNPSKRFASAAEALAALPLPVDVSTAQQQKEHVAVSEPPVEDVSIIRSRNEVEWLKPLLQSYPGSRWGNSETRGMDSGFAERTYVPTEIEETLQKEILNGDVRLAVLCGNAGDGKTALLQHLAGNLARRAFGRVLSEKRIAEGELENGTTLRINLDGSAAWKGQSSDKLLDKFLAPFREGPPKENIVHLLAINDGRLLEWIYGPKDGPKKEQTPLTRALASHLEKEEQAQDASLDPHIHFINLNHRSLVGAVVDGKKEVSTDFLNQLVDALYGGEDAESFWKPCQSCTARDRCEVFRATELFGPHAEESRRQYARSQLFDALQAVHLRGEVHITVRELRAALVYILFGTHYCSEYHEPESDQKPHTYSERAFSPDSPDRQGKVLDELLRFDPALEAHPLIDRKLLQSGEASEIPGHLLYHRLSLKEARRRAYFEWPEELTRKVTGSRESDDPGMLGLAQGRQLKQFRDLAFGEGADGLVKKVCDGISRLETLPPIAWQSQSKNAVPLKIQPRTPTETFFWVEKQLSDFRLKPVMPEHKGMEWLHREACLTYTYRDGRQEKLYLGADLFHLLLEIAGGYQLGDVASDDIFAQLSIFVRRLVREDERRVYAWHPREEDRVHEISVQQMDRAGGKPLQQMVIAHRTERKENHGH